MWFFILACICCIFIIAAGIPSAVNNGNRTHIENDREPNAGVAILPDIIVMIPLWWAAGSGLDYLFGFQVAIILVISISLMIFTLSIRNSVISNREYKAFLYEHEAKTKSKAEQNAGG
jgi:hypothetical protein